MTRKMENALKKESRKEFGSIESERARKYIYGAMRKSGWSPKKK